MHIFKTNNTFLFLKVSSLLLKLYLYSNLYQTTLHSMFDNHHLSYYVTTQKITSNSQTKLTYNPHNQHIINLINSKLKFS